MAIIQQDKDETIEGLEAENKALLQKLALVQEELLRAKDENSELRLETARIALLEAENGEKDDLLAKTEEQLKTASDELTAIRSKWWYRLFAGKKGK